MTDFRTDDAGLAAMHGYDAMQVLQSYGPNTHQGPAVDIMRLRPGPIAWWQPGTMNPVQMVGVPLCQDLLRYEQLGEADGLRGRVVRGLFWLLRIWP